MNAKTRAISPVAILLTALLASGCGDPTVAVDANQPPTGGDAGGEDHGAGTALGTLTVAGRTFAVQLLGEVKADVECALELEPKGGNLDGDNVYVWLESEDGKQVSVSAKSVTSSGPLHFHATPAAGEPAVRVVVRLRAEGVDERASLPLDGHGHEHVDGSHHGVPATFSGGDLTGALELKLHDDKGDLELWLTDAAGKVPFDLPIDASIEVEFVDKAGRKVALQVRDQDSNVDEDGNANLRDGKTNYFISPSRDAEWRKGKDFQSIVIVRFTRGGQAFVSEEFVLAPHTH